MTMRILEHDNDADARLVAILMHKLKLDSIIITASDEAAMAHDVEGQCLVLGQMADGSVELRFVDDDDLPDDDESIN